MTQFGSKEEEPVRKNGARLLADVLPDKVCQLVSILQQ